jgi:hypothetical protein
MYGNLSLSFLCGALSFSIAKRQEIHGKIAHGHPRRPGCNRAISPNSTLAVGGLLMLLLLLLLLPCPDAHGTVQPGPARGGKQHQLHTHIGN